MEDFELGKFIYVGSLIWTAIAWQIFNIGAVGLIHEVSSLFSIVISVLGLPVIPVLAVIFFHDKMDGVKANFHGVGYLGLYFIFSISTTLMILSPRLKIEKSKKFQCFPC